MHHISKAHTHQLCLFCLPHGQFEMWQLMLVPKSPITVSQTLYSTLVPIGHLPMSALHHLWDVKLSYVHIIPFAESQTQPAHIGIEGSTEILQKDDCFLYIKITSCFPRWSGLSFGVNFCFGGNFYEKCHQVSTMNRLFKKQ